MGLPDLQAALDFLEEGDNFLITSHVDSDWDGLGSCIALKLLLEKLGKNSFVVVHNLPVEFHCFLDGGEHVLTVEETGLAKVDYAIVLDCPSLERIGDVRRHMNEATRILNIDHHEDALAFGAVNLMSTKVSSACEFVYHLVVASGREIDATMAAQLYVGILFDTGGFRYSLATPTTFEVAAELVRRGARLDYIADQLFNNKSVASVKLIGKALDSLELHCNGKAAVLHLAHADLREGSAQGHRQLRPYDPQRRGSPALAGSESRELSRQFALPESSGRRQNRGPVGRRRSCQGIGLLFGGPMGKRLENVAGRGWESLELVSRRRNMSPLFRRSIPAHGVAFTRRTLLVRLAQAPCEPAASAA